jgi:ERCC4-type nuclease
MDDCAMFKWRWKPRRTTSRRSKLTAGASTFSVRATSSFAEVRLGSRTSTYLGRSARALRSAVARNQLAKLRAACAFPYLLVEGTDLDRGGLHPNAVRGVCLAAIDQGIALLRSDHQRDSARWLHRLAVRCQREELPAERPAYVQRVAAAPDTVAEAMLAAVPGVSTVGARAVLERFGSLAGLLAAPVDEWLTVPGIGRERARALAEALGVSRSARLTTAADRR